MADIKGLSLPVLEFRSDKTEIVKTQSGCQFFFSTMKHKTNLNSDIPQPEHTKCMMMKQHIRKQHPRKKTSRQLYQQIIVQPDAKPHITAANRVIKPLIKPNSHFTILQATSFPLIKPTDIVPRWRSHLITFRNFELSVPNKSCLVCVLVLPLSTLILSHQGPS